MGDFDSFLPWWRRRSTLFVLIALVVIVFTVSYCASQPSPIWVPGHWVSLVPEQSDTERDPWLSSQETTITPLAEYSIEARVLGKNSYSDQGAFLSPMDLALGWGEMSDEGVLQHLNIRQSGRWYYYGWKSSPPIEQGKMIEQSANTHIIPANDAVLDVMDRVEVGDRVRLKGVLVAVSRPDGWRWRSSITRTDTGNGSCELMWVESAEILPHPGKAVDASPIKR